MIAPDIGRVSTTLFTGNMREIGATVARPVVLGDHVVDPVDGRTYPHTEALQYIINLLCRGARDLRSRNSLNLRNLPGLRVPPRRNMPQARAGHIRPERHHKKEVGTLLERPLLRNAQPDHYFHGNIPLILHQNNGLLGHRKRSPRPHHARLPLHQNQLHHRNHQFR